MIKNKWDQNAINCTNSKRNENESEISFAYYIASRAPRKENDEVPLSATIYVWSLIVKIINIMIIGN